MAILIPSKHIYGDIENPKVRNNLISRVNIEQTVITPNDEYDIPVFNNDYTDFSKSTYAPPEDFAAEDVEVTTKHTGTGTNSVTVAFVSYCGTRDYKRTEFNLVIPIVKNNRFIKSISFGKNSANEHNIKYDIYCSKETGEAKGIFSYDYAENTYSLRDGVELTFEKLDETKKYSIPTNVTNEYIGTHSYTGLEGTSTSSVKVYKHDTIYTAKPVYQVDDIYLDFSVISEVTIVKMGFNHVIVSSSGYTAVGTYEKYIPKQINITIYGNTVGINIADGTVTYGENGIYPYTINGNELTQNSAPSLNALANKIISEYSEGKETATIRCDIGEYYLYDSTKPKNQGDKVISTTDSDLNMTFTEGDIVIPMIPSAMGGDEPMSRYQDGKPKQFRVVGTSIINDGAIWQKIYLQEV